MPVTLGGLRVQGQPWLPRKLEVIIPETLFEKQKTISLNTLKSPRKWEGKMEGGVWWDAVP